MVQETLVKEWIDAGWNVVVQFGRNIAPVDAAFWARSRDSGNWHLYVASGAVDKGRAPIYEAIGAILKRISNGNRLQFKINLLTPNHAAVDNVRRHRDDFHRANMLLFSPNDGLGNMAVDAFYIYPSIPAPPQGGNPMTYDELRKTIFDLLGRTGHVPPSTITLQDGTSFQGVPFGIEVSSDVMNVKFVDEASHLPRVVLVDQIASIQ